VTGVRIRWRGVARAAAIVVVALLAVRLLPGLLRAPEPPPLGRDVGLPRAKPAAARRAVAAKPRPAVAKPPPKSSKLAAPERARRSRPKPVAVPDAAASTARIGTRGRRPKRRHPAHPQAKPKRSPTPKPTPESAPPPAAEVVPEPLPEPPPTPRSTPGDGSQEFAPR